MYFFKNIKYYFFIIICYMLISNEVMAQTISWSQVNSTPVPFSRLSMVLILTLSLFLMVVYFKIKKHPYVIKNFIFVITMFTGAFLIGSGMLNNLALAFSLIVNINSPSGTKHLSENGITQVVNNYSKAVRISSIDANNCSISSNSCSINTVLNTSESCEISVNCHNEVPIYTGGLTNLECPVSGGNIALPTANFTDPDGGSVGVGYSVQNPFSCGSINADINYFATGTDDEGDSTNSPTYIIKKCPAGETSDGHGGCVDINSNDE